MRQSSTVTLRSFFGETGVATIGQMEANLPELACWSTTSSSTKCGVAKAWPHAIRA
jgi:hypothetical protein